jgi:hypothetical protein
LIPLRHRTPRAWHATPQLGDANARRQVERRVVSVLFSRRSSFLHSSWHTRRASRQPQWYRVDRRPKTEPCLRGPMPTSTTPAVVRFHVRSSSGRPVLTHTQRTTSSRSL